MYDLIIEGGSIIDGTGCTRFVKDIGIKDERIRTLGNLENEEACRRINAKDKIVSPGFVDIHSHSDFHIMQFPFESNKLLQGVTTEVTGHCGYSPFPILDSRIEYFKELMEANNIKPPKGGYTTEDFLNSLEKTGLGVNIVPLVGHGIIRINAMGFNARRPNENEFEIMKALLEEAMEAGCYGMSTGLGYPPGFFCDTEELIELSKIVSKYDGTYATHLRNQGDYLLQSIEEALTIGIESGASINISHLKACEKRNWGKAVKGIELIEASRKKGLKVMCDFYPYKSTSNSLSSLFPRWLHEGGTEKFIQRIRDREIRKKIFIEMLECNEKYWDRIIVGKVGRSRNKHREGKSISKLAIENGCTPLEFALNLLIAEKESVEVICELMWEEDIEFISRYPFAGVGSDGYAMSDDNQGFKGHPRNYGTFPRFLGSFVREKNIIPLEEGIRRITALPAEFLNIKDRGLIREGMFADIVIFDKNRIIDKSTYESPSEYPEGIEQVIVNGSIQIDNKENHGVPVGKVLRRGK